MSFLHKVFFVIYFLFQVLKIKNIFLETNHFMNLSVLTSFQKKFVSFLVSIIRNFIKIYQLMNVLVRLFLYHFLFGFNVQQRFKGQKFVCVGVKFLAFNVLLHTKNKKRQVIDFVTLKNHNRIEIRYFFFEKQTFNGFFKVLGIRKDGRMELFVTCRRTYVLENHL